MKFTACSFITHDLMGGFGCCLFAYWFLMVIVFLHKIHVKVRNCQITFSTVDRDLLVATETTNCCNLRLRKALLKSCLLKYCVSLDIFGKLSMWLLPLPLGMKSLPSCAWITSCKFRNDKAIHNLSDAKTN